MSDQLFLLSGVRGAGPFVSLVAVCFGATLGAQSPIAHPSTHEDAPARCTVVCTPTATLMPGVLRTHLARGPIVRSTATGIERRLPGSSTFQILAAVSSRTAIPRASLFGSVQWLPNENASRNPFTLYTASELGDDVHANAPTVTVGVSIAALQPAEAHGWADVAMTVGDQFSHAARPHDQRDYTHKLDLGLLAQLHAFAWASPGTYLHRTSVYALLDYVATGLPRAGDEVPEGRVFVTRARPLALGVGLAMPLTPAER